MSRQKNMRRISVLVTAQTAYNLARLAAMDGGNQGRVIDKLVRDRMVMLKEAVLELPGSVRAGHPEGRKTDGDERPAPGTVKADVLHGGVG